MRLSDLLVRETVLYGLESREKEPVLSEMLEVVVSAGRIGSDCRGDLLDSLMRRERLGTTGIGKGIAIPHAKHDTVTGLVTAVGRSCEGIEFASLDNEPVYTVFLLLANPAAAGEHLAALERISAIVRDQDYWRFLRNAASGEEILEIIAEADERFGD